MSLTLSGGVAGSKGQPESSGVSTSNDESEFEDTVPEEAYLEAAFPPVDTQLHLPAPGVYGTHTPDRRWGTARTVKAIEAVASTWNARHPDLRFGVGDISKQGGGPIGGHKSHQHGVDFDVRPLRADGKEEGVVYQDGAYSRDRTKELIELFINNGIAPVKVIFFNDAHIGIDKVHPWPNHDNHFHVRFELG